jgi:AcrR family transcriptional regulator
MKIVKVGGAQERILKAAVQLFARVGYNGVSTREIALAADVNEATIYRHFPKKRDLFNAALESELRTLTLSAELVGQLGNTTDLQSGFRLIFQIISQALGRRPNLVRLLQFGALEIGPELTPLYRQYLGELLAMSGSYLKNCQDASESRVDPYMAALVLAGAAVSQHGFYQLFHDETSSLTCHESAAMYADLLVSGAIGVQGRTDSVSRVTSKVDESPSERVAD